jgi:hypothetical protein
LILGSGHLIRVWQAHFNGDAFNIDIDSTRKERFSLANQLATALECPDHHQSSDEECSSGNTQLSRNNKNKRYLAHHVLEFSQTGSEGLEKDLTRSSGQKMFWPGWYIVRRLGKRI